jgi:hypothetical protein
MATAETAPGKVRYFRAPSAPCSFVTAAGKRLVADDGIFSTEKHAEAAEALLQLAGIGNLAEVSKEQADAIAADHAADSLSRRNGVL